MRHKNQELVESVFRNLDAWVAQFGPEKYVPEDFIPVATPVTHGIQQVRKEIFAFVEILIAKRLRGSILEIGLGVNGSTHKLWRDIFSQVVTIEMHDYLVTRFLENLKSFDKENCEEDKSEFIIGMSHSPDIVNQVYSRLSNGIDVLFIDGDHSYPAVLSDWLLYHNLVGPGGIVAFHDSACSAYEVTPFIRKLDRGEIDGKKRHMKHIIYSQNVGISYYEVTPDLAEPCLFNSPFLEDEIQQL